MAENPKVEVTISRDELTQALVYFAARKAGFEYPLHHQIKINGSLMLMGGDADADKFCTVTLEHLPNVTPIGKNPKRGKKPDPAA